MLLDHNLNSCLLSLNEQSYLQPIHSQLTFLIKFLGLFAYTHSEQITLYTILPLRKAIRKGLLQVYHIYPNNNFCTCNYAFLTFPWINLFPSYFRHISSTCTLNFILFHLPKVTTSLVLCVVSLISPLLNYFHQHTGNTGILLFVSSKKKVFTCA